MKNKLSKNCQIGGTYNKVLAEKGEVFKDNNGYIKKISNNAPTHDDGILINKNGNIKEASYNNGGIIVDNVNSVLSATHENRDSNDKSYSIEDEIIKIKPKELSEYAKQLGLKIKVNKSISPAKAFEILSEYRDKQYMKYSKPKENLFSSKIEQNSLRLNQLNADMLPTDDYLYESLLNIQEAKKLI